MENPLRHYLTAVATWFFSFGIHQVLFVWLLTIWLRESADRVGYAQMTVTLPTTLLVLVAGALADQYGGRRLAIWAQGFALIAPASLIVGLWLDTLSYSWLIFYALVLGISSAFLTPARDGLVTLFAAGRLQRVVALSTLMQFGLQLVGFALAGAADRFHPVYLVTCQLLALAFGIWSLVCIRVSVDTRQTADLRLLLKHLRTSLVDGSRQILRSPVMRATGFLNCAMGLFFMGSYMVTLPLLARDSYDGNASDIALMNAVNSAGLVVTIFLLVRLGELERPGRALLLSQLIGTFFLAGVALTSSFTVVLVLLFGWGICGGVALSTARSLIQGRAQVEMRARAMAFYIFSFGGAGALGSVYAGQLAEHLGAPNALLVCSGSMFVAVLLTFAFSRLASVGASIGDYG